MVTWVGKRRCGPIGVDIGSRCVKLLQFDAERQRVREAARWDFSGEKPADPGDCDERVVEAIGRAREGREFRGRDAVLCLGSADLFVQNIRVAHAVGPELGKIVLNEAAPRLPFPREEAEVRYVEAADVRQGDSVRREVIVMACRRPMIARLLAIAERAQLNPRAIDVEPGALLRCYSRQFRRDEDQDKPLILVNVGASTTTVVIARNASAMFVKYLDLGGQQMDEAVARDLKMRPADAATMRRHNGDRRADQRDPEIARSVAEAIRPVLDRLAHELSLCVRYYSVTFRGEPLSRLVVGGGEATQALVDWLGARLDVPCEQGNPLRAFESPALPGRPGQWDVVAGLALREIS